MSIKSTIAAVAASPFLFAGAAFAGPYVNVETVQSYSGDDYTGLSTELQSVTKARTGMYLVVLS